MSMDEKFDGNLIKIFLDSGLLLSPDFFSSGSKGEEVLKKIKERRIEDGPFIINKDLIPALTNGKNVADINWLEFEKSKVMIEKGIDNRAYWTFLDILNYNVDLRTKEKLDLMIKEIKREDIVVEKEIEKEANNNIGSVVVLRNFNHIPRKIGVKDFVSCLKARYEFFKKILQNRKGMENLVSVNRLREQDNVGVVGLVYDIKKSKSGSIILTLEDSTGMCKVLISNSNINRNGSNFGFNGNGVNLGELICNDEVIGVSGIYKNNLLIARNIFFPDVAINNEKKFSDEEVYAAFISDVHVGSSFFYEKEFNRFVEWVNGDYEGESGEIGRKVRYLFVIGDLIDGVGVFPNQESYLIVKDVREQYKKAAEIFSRIRKDVKIVICPGQHDAVRRAEPQPILDREYADDFYKMENVVLVSNPALVNIGATKNFEGFNVLMYHGASFHYYINNIPLLRELNARDSPSYLLKLLLQKRHLAPSHTSTTFLPADNDPLVIDKVPDIFVSGEMHRSEVSNYNGVITINCSCWQSMTDFQEKTGNNPDPCKVPVLNLKNREVRIVKFIE